MYICRECKQNLSESDFQKDYQNKLGHKTICTKCLYKKQLEYLRDNNYTIKCKNCGKNKQASNFRKDSSTQTGYVYTCKQCEKQKIIAARKEIEQNNTRLKCKKCKETKSYTEFKVSNDTKIGYSYTCKSCIAKIEIQRQKDSITKGLKIKCRICKAKKPCTEFHKDRTSSNGFGDICKTCYQENKEEEKAKILEKQLEFEKSQQNKLICSTCNQEKSLSEFYRSTQTKTGYCYTCISCYSKYIQSKQAQFTANHLVCTRCKKKKKLSAFSIDKFRQTGYNGTCKACEHQILISPSKSLNYFDRLKKYGNPETTINEEGFIEVKCKNCKTRFLPTLAQINVRLTALEEPGKGEGHFYCSDKCKNECVLFGFKTTSIDPRSKIAVSISEQEQARRCQTYHLKLLQIDDIGYTYCEKCGKEGDVDLHHTLPVHQYGKKSISSASHILLCKDCHQKITIKC